MNDALKMQISAFVDGELPTGEAELLIRRLAQDAELREQADAYMTIGRLMRGERSAAGADGLRQRIAEAVEAESELAAAAASWSENRWVRSAAGVAI
ncbi:MAG: sigma-E factor negative regulatory protein, partial [Woeseia sp.]